MPELPEVETVMRGLKPLLLGHKILKVTTQATTLRTKPIPRTLSTHLVGRTITTLSRRAKYIMAGLDDGNVILIHLGMTGGFFMRDPSHKPEKHDLITLDLSNHTRVAYHDPRRFGQFDVVPADKIQTHKSLCDLGPEPLGPEFTPAVLTDALKGRKNSIKAALLDQRRVAGLGNIYVSEALYMSGIHPEAVAGQISPARVKRLHTAIQDVLNAAIKAGGSTLRDYRKPDGELGFFQDRFSVYGRAGLACPDCSCDLARTGGIAKIVQNGRSTFYCARRQR
jgi:formamidopyrimidine-DNA glycosylase